MHVHVYEVAHFSQKMIVLGICVMLCYFVSLVSNIMCTHTHTHTALCTRLRSLQERDDEKVANEKAKNNLESYIFETQAWLEVNEVVAVSSEEQRENIRAAIREVYDWFEEEGYYSAETKVSLYS